MAQIYFSRNFLSIFRFIQKTCFLCLLFFCFSLVFADFSKAETSNDDVKQADIVFDELEQKGKLTAKIIHWGATFLLGLSIVVSGILLAMGKLNWSAAIALISGGLLVGAASSIARFLTGFNG